MLKDIFIPAIEDFVYFLSEKNIPIIFNAVGATANNTKEDNERLKLILS